MWRRESRKVIKATYDELGYAYGRPHQSQELTRALREAYPFGERKMWPYKMWLIELAVARGERPAEAAATATDHQRASARQAAWAEGVEGWRGR
jgi:hypothetical protein